MKIEILRDTVFEGKPVKVGDQPEGSDHHAKTLILLGKAKAVETDAKADKNPGTKPENKKTEPSPAKEPTPADGIEAALEGDHDLGEGDSEAVPDLNALSYESLVEMAEDYGVKKSHKLNKAKLIEEIKAAQAKKAA
jgi:hypothetical protein